MNNIITTYNISEALYYYNQSVKALKDAKDYLKVLESELKGVKTRSSNKAYQSYKASTKGLRTYQIELIQKRFNERHEAYRKWDKLVKLETIQNKASNKQQRLETLLKSLNHEELQLLKEYFNNI